MIRETERIIESFYNKIIEKKYSMCYSLKENK